MFQSFFTCNAMYDKGARAISNVVCHGGGSVWTSDSKVPRNTGIACAWREGSENITIC